MSGELRAATGKGSKEIKDPPGRPRAMARRLQEGGPGLTSGGAGRMPERVPLGFGAHNRAWDLKSTRPLTRGLLAGPLTC